MTYKEAVAEAFANRPRYTYDEALAIVMERGPWINHLLDNQDGTYSTMGHITCDSCDYCDAEQAATDGWNLKPGMVHIAKAESREGGTK